MEKKKIDRIIEAFRHYIQLKEDGMGGGSVIANSANAPNTGGSLGADSPNKNMQGYSKVMGFTKRRRPDYRTVLPSHKSWVKSLENK